MIVRALTAGLLLMAIVPCLASKADEESSKLGLSGGEDWRSVRKSLDIEFQKELASIATKCDEFKLDEQARTTRRWFIVRDPKRQYLFLPQSTKPQLPKGSKLVEYWSRKFLEVRREQAETLFQLARQALKEEDPAAAYQLLYEVLHEDPDHEEARRILGYRLVNGIWRRRGVEHRSHAARSDHPQFGWRRRKYWIVDTPHYRITTNRSSKEGLALGRSLEDLYDLWRQIFVRYWTSQEALERLFNSDSTASRGRIKKMQVVLFDDRAEYVSQLKPSEPQIELSLGFYRDHDQKAYFYAGDQSLAPTRYHEATHQLFQETERTASQVGASANFWLVEGVALYMESLAKGDGYYTVGGFDASRLQFARFRALNERFYVPLSELTKMGRDDLQQDERIRRIYSQSSGLAHFLIDSEGGRYREALVNYLMFVYQGRDLKETLSLTTRTNLEELDKKYHQFLSVSDGDLKFIESPQSVKNLSLGHTQVTDIGLAQLSECIGLEWLDLAFTDVTDRGLANLKNSTSLTQLNLEQTKVSGDSLEMIGRFEKLESLDLSGLKISDDDLAQLTGLKNLKVLWLTDTAISDAGLVHLQGLTKLKTLEVSGTRVTDEGWRKLKSRIPALERPK